MLQKSVGLNRTLTRLIVFCGLLALASALPTLDTELNTDDNALSLSEQLIDAESSAQDAQDELESAEDAEVDLQAGQFMRKGMKYKYSKYKSMKVYKYKSHGYKSSYSKMGRHRTFYVYGLYGRPYGYHRYRYGRSQHNIWTRPENASEHLPKPTANSSVLVFVKSNSSDQGAAAKQIRLEMWNRLKISQPNNKVAEAVWMCYNNGIGGGCWQHSCTYTNSSMLETCLDKYMKIYFEQPTPASAVTQEDLQMSVGSDSDTAFPKATSSQAYGWLEVMGTGSEEAAASLNNDINAGTVSAPGLITGAGSSVVLENPAPALSPLCSATIATFMASLVLLI